MVNTELYTVVKTLPQKWSERMQILKTLLRGRENPGKHADYGGIIRVTNV